MFPMSLVSASLACGGLFCDSPPPPEPGFEVALPVEQTGETVVFGVDSGFTTMHVQVAYEGPAEEFAWVLPVPAEPEVLRSTPRLFDALRFETSPIYRVQRSDRNCTPSFVEGDSDTDSDTDADTDADADADSDADVPGVDVIARGLVGPYETVTLQAADPVVLTEWLQTEGFAVPSGLAAMLQPYVGQQTHFLALKLAKDNDVGDLEPVAIRYAGEEPAIPIQLTAVAVADDMPIEVFVLGQHRAVPSNYLHVKLNPLKLGWANGVQDDSALLNVAMDEAGGRAFVTESALPASRVRLAPLQGYDLTPLEGQPSVIGWLDTLETVGLSWLTVEDLERVLPIPAGLVPPEVFYSAPGDYPKVVDLMDFDPLEATAALQSRIVEPVEDADEMVQRAVVVTRLRSSMSGSEMTLDPKFTFSPELPWVPRERVLTLTRHCGSSEDSLTTPYHIEVQGLSFQGPTERELNWLDLDILEWLEQASDVNALVIEEGSDEGFLPVVDQMERLQADLALPRAERSCAGCASTSLGWRSALGALPALLLLFRRR